MKEHAKVRNSTSYIGTTFECDDCGNKLTIKQNGALCTKCNALYTLNQCVKLKINNRHNLLYVDIKSKEDPRKSSIAN